MYDSNYVAIVLVLFLYIIRVHVFRKHKNDQVYQQSTFGILENFIRVDKYLPIEFP